MRRFVVIPCIVGVCVVLLGLSQVLTEARSGPLVSRLPGIDSRLLPGNKAPYGLDCTATYEELGNQFCDLGNIYLIVHNNEIAYTFMGTYGSGLTVGEVMNEWGQPSGAEYNTFCVLLYWPDRYAYIYVGDTFNPSSRVGYVSYGKSRRWFGTWRGYTNTQR